MDIRLHLIRVSERMLVNYRDAQYGLLEECERRNDIERRLEVEQKIRAVEEEIQRRSEYSESLRKDLQLLMKTN